MDNICSIIGNAERNNGKTERLIRMQTDWALNTVQFLFSLAILDFGFHFYGWCVHWNQSVPSPISKAFVMPSSSNAANTSNRIVCSVKQRRYHIASICFTFLLHFTQHMRISSVECKWFKLFPLFYILPPSSTFRVLPPLLWPFSFTGIPEKKANRSREVKKFICWWVSNWFFSSSSGALSQSLFCQ